MILLVGIIFFMLAVGWGIMMASDFLLSDDPAKTLSFYDFVPLVLYLIIASASFAIYIHNR